MTDQDTSDALLERVNTAIEARAPLQIRAGGSKDFYGRAPRGDILDLRSHRGIVTYEPAELILTARAGTPLSELESVLDQHHQLLPFEPPHFGPHATIGGAVACGLSGPGRPWAGSARDLVLGTRVINGRGEVLRFGGEVMKNVAGYDISRLMAGALGTLGVILDISMKVLPKPECETSLVFDMSAQAAIDKIAAISTSPYPLSGAMHVDNLLYLRLSGARAGVDAARRQLGGEQLGDNAIWTALREHALPFFTSQKTNLWRLSLPPACAHITDLGEQLIDWGGAQRWLLSNEEADSIRAVTESHRGHATCFRATEEQTRSAAFHPLDTVRLRLHHSVKNAFDPHHIFNPGRLYPEEGVA